MNSLKLILLIALPVSAATYFLSGYSWVLTMAVFIVLA